VVKNVAGFDLTRALTGSWGTLAALTAVHLRLRARPAVDVTLALPVAPEAVAAVTRGPLAPIALVALDAADSRAVGPDDGTRTLLRLGGNAAFVAEARAALAAIVEVDADTWTAVRARCAPPDRAVRWRWDALSRRLRARFDPAGILNPGLLGPLAEAAA
jgi:FAD/FMN-containing dehydrogenase